VCPLGALHRVDRYAYADVSAAASGATHPEAQDHNPACSNSRVTCCYIMLQYVTWYTSATVGRIDLAQNGDRLRYVLLCSR
jgi:hypothetical protein